MKFKENLIDYAFLIFTAIVIILGGVGLYTNLCITLSITGGLLYLGLKLIQNIKLVIPKNFYLYLIFILSLLAHTLVFHGKLFYFWIFLSGGLFWLLVYNLKGVASKYFSFFLIFLGVSMALLMIYSNLHGVFFQTQESLYLPLSNYTQHNHLGDLWALVLIPIIYGMLVKVQKWHYPVILAGLLLIAVSLSRSAILSLAAGGIYIFYNFQVRKMSKKYLIGLIITCSLLFIFFSFFKTTLFSRPYYLESINSIFHSPLGIGMGNFATVGAGVELTHDIVLEVVLGMGIFSVVFVLWLIQIIKVLAKSSENTLFKAVFIALGVNFLFDTTYAIPAMVWVWFCSLALI